MPPSVPGDVEIPNKLLIDEIRKRPILYDKSVPGYTSTEAKRKKWQDIGAEIFPDYWDKWNKIEKREAIIAMQKRWANLRTSFARELKRSAAAGRKVNGPEFEEKKYRYHDRMTFLIKYLSVKLDGVSEDSCQQDTLDSENNSDQEDWQEEYDEQYLEDSVPEEEYEKKSNSELENKKARKRIKTENYQEIIMDDPLTVRNRRDAHVEESTVDQDVNFAMSLVPMLKGLSLNKKLEAQIEILKVFQRINDD